MESRTARWLIRFGSVVALLFLYIPLVIVVLYAFNDSIGQKWPISHFTTKYFSLAWHNTDLREALINSLLIASVATVLALLLGSAAAFAVHRYRFFGRNSLSLMLVLPITLPGIVTAIALNSSFNTFGISLGLLTIMIGHATFCIVVVYNNVIARLRRTPTSLVEASQDLGADGWQTFRYVTFPAIKTALVAGALLAFALSFDEIIVTNFVAGTQLTVPKFIYDNLRQPRNRPIVNVVAVIAMLVMIVPVHHRAATGGWGAGHRLRGRGRRRCEGRSVRRRDALEVLAAAPRRAVVRRGLLATGQTAPAELLELRPGRRLLREHRGLDTVEQALQPADQLGLGDPDLRFARHRADGRGERGELLLQIRGDRRSQFLNGALIHVRQPLAS